jgi:hypothetical protein
MFRARLVLIFCLFLFAQFGAARQTATTSPQSPQRDPQAVALLQQAVAALGVAPASLTASGTYARFLADSTVSYPLRVEVLGFDRFHWEVDTPDLGTVTTVVSGTASWSQSTTGD